MCTRGCSLPQEHICQPGSPSPPSSKGPHTRAKNKPMCFYNTDLGLTCYHRISSFLPLDRRRQWHPTPVLLPGKPHGREPGGLQSMGSLRVMSDFTFTFHFHASEKEMATHSSVLAWRIPGTGEPDASICGVTQSRTQLKRPSSISSSRRATCRSQTARVRLPRLRQFMSFGV